VLEDRRVPTLTLDPAGMNPLDPGGKTVYSSDTQTHWLRDADLARTEQFNLTNINEDGAMTFSQAKAWVAGMNSANNGQGYLGHTNWTLPGGFVGAGFDLSMSDMGNLFYNEFGAYPGESITQINPPYFRNFQPNLYWFGGAKKVGAEQFSFGNGFQGTSKEEEALYVIPEYSDSQPHGTKLPADVSPVKSPPTDFPPASNSLVTSTDGTIVYDKALDISWLADANLAATHTFGLHQGVNTSPKDPSYLNININPDGSMSYATAVAWIAAMNARDYLGHNNWRLPMATIGYTTADYYITGSGIGDAFQGSEMGELYYTELGLSAGSSIVFPTDATERPFKHFQPYLYWAGTQTNATDANGNGHSTFSFGNGFQGANVNINEMYVIPVFDSPRKVTSTSDSGPGSLRWVIGAAHGGDSIDLTGVSGAITLQSPIIINVDAENEDDVLDIQGPGNSKLAISGNNVTGIFVIGPYISGDGVPGDAVAGLPATTISDLTLENAVETAGLFSGVGGAILDVGASLTLKSDIFEQDQVLGGEFDFLGGISNQPALGGALAVLGDASVDMAVRIEQCQFSQDAAIGGAGFAANSGGVEQEFAGSTGQGGAIYVDAQDSTALSVSVTHTEFSDDSAVGGDGLNGNPSSGITPTVGAAGEGGALFVSADRAAFPSFSITSDTFFNCSASGGSGGDGAAGDSGQDGAKGGHARGGALFYSGGGASYPYLSVASSMFLSSVALAGNGGAGGAASTRASNGGAGGSGGDGFGGALFANFASSTGGVAALLGDTYSFNSSQGGNGGTGGAGGKAATGGAGGAGGLAGGGAIAVTINGPAAAPVLNLLQSGVTANTAQGGNGGDGGTGQNGGRGGNGAGIGGAGLYLNGSGGNSPGTWTLSAVTVELNFGYSGNGGAGGNGTRTGGNGGNSKNSLGGGIYDAFAGTLDLYQCTIESNDLNDGAGGSGGQGSTTGADGQNSVSHGGGLYIDLKVKAQATPDTIISGNDADRRPDVFGTLGTL
jgi:hypothetical protein